MANHTLRFGSGAVVLPLALFGAGCFYLGCGGPSGIESDARANADAGADGGTSSDPCAHEPAGYTRFNEQPWDAAPIRNVQTPQGWIDDYDNGAQAFSIVSDPTSPFPSPNHNVIRGHFPQGAPGGSSPFFVYRQFDPAEQYKNIYFCLLLKHDANFDNTNGNTGTKFIWLAGDQVQGTQLYTSHNQSNMEFTVYQQGTVDRSLDPTLDPTAAQLIGRRGSWVTYELLFKANTANGTADGELHAWIDGVKTQQFTNVDYQMTPARTWLSIGWNPTYGGGLNPVPRDQYQDMDHLRLSGSNL
jgi:hypothetical protein